MNRHIILEDTGRAPLYGLLTGWIVSVAVFATVGLLIGMRVICN